MTNSNLPFVSPDTFKKGLELLVVLDAVLGTLKDDKQFAAIKAELKQDLINANAAREEAHTLSTQNHEKSQVLEKLEKDLKDLADTLGQREDTVVGAEQDLKDKTALFQAEVETFNTRVEQFNIDSEVIEDKLTKREAVVKEREDRVDAETKQVAAKEKELDEKLKEIADFGKSVAKKG